ncbi:MAG: beta-glucanase precursor [Opitutaceae bacterium]|nr:beta-glucanase precursor [Verrucomicrobiales bacterium]
MNPRPSIIPIAIGILMALPATQAEVASAPPAASPAATPAPAAPPALDFGNFSSEAITGKAWEAYNAKNYVNAKAYAQKCMDMFKDQAVAMQKALTAPATVKEEVFRSWALNDVGACYYILGQSLEAEGKGKEAIVPFKFLVENLSFAQCWDAKGWFWKPADAASERVKALEFDALK